MKSKKIKMVLPALVLMLAVFGAFAFKSAEDKALLAPETGWASLPGQPCAIQVQCDNEVNPFVCTVVHEGITRQAFGLVSKNPPICNKVLYRLMPSQ